MACEFVHNRNSRFRLPSCSLPFAAVRRGREGVARGDNSGMRHLANLPAKKLIAVAAVPALLALLTIGTASADWSQPTAITNEADEMRKLYLLVVAMAALVFLVVEGALVIMLIRYKKRSNDLPPQIEGNNLLEIIWTGIPIVIVVVLFVFSFIVLVRVENKAEEEDLTIRVNAFQYSWEFVYNTADLGQATGSPEAGEISIIGTAEDEPVLVIPVGEPVHFELRANDVIHSFYVRNFLYKLDVIPGRDNDFVVTAHTTGTFEAQCAELCGLNHALMRFELRVVERAEFDAWVAEQEIAAAPEAAARVP